MHQEVTSPEEKKESELILAHAWDTMLKLNFLCQADRLVAKLDSSVDANANESTVGSDVAPMTGFFTFVERLFVWVLDKVKL